MNKKNPFLSYGRQIKTWIALPSGTSYYNNKIIDFTETGEVGIRAMTGEDEMILKNPDALLNGEALRSVLLSCVDGLKKPDELLNNDVDALMIAIRHVTYGDSNEYTPICPNCQVKNTFAINIGGFLDDIQHLEPEYTVDLSNGLVVFLKPYTFKDRILTLRMVFEQEKLKKSLDMDDSDKSLKVMSSAMKTMSDLNLKMMTNAIMRVTDVPKGIDVAQTDSTRADFLELLRGLEKSDFAIISEKLTEINKIGITSSVPATCKECNHQWEADIDLNPVNFSLAS